MVFEFPYDSIPNYEDFFNYIDRVKNKDVNIILLLVNKYKYSHDPKIIKMITFLQNFILKDQTRTEKDVGIILGISQQAVNKRKKKLWKIK